jgi:hypothetical protein
MVPGFMQLLQDDQIALLKSASYGIMLLYAAQSYIPERNCFIYNQQLINVDMFMSTILNKTQPQQQQQQQLYLDDEERYFIQDNFEFIRQIKQFNLSNTETALLSAIILFNSDNNNLNDQKSVYHNNQRFIELLRMDIENNRSHQSPSSLEKQQMLQQLLNLVSVNLRRLTQSHFELIKSFKIHNPSIEFPPLHRELFNVDYYVYCHQQQQMQLQQQQQQQQLQPIGTNMPMVNRFSNSAAAATGASNTPTATATNGVQYSNYAMMQQVQNVNKSSPSPSSCSSTSSSSNIDQSAITPPLTNSSEHQLNTSQTAVYNANNSNQTNKTNKQQNGFYSTSSPSSASSSSNYMTPNSLESMQTIDDVLLSNMNSNKVVNLQSSNSPISTSSSISPPSYASLSSTYSSMIKSEPLF